MRNITELSREFDTMHRNMALILVAKEANFTSEVISFDESIKFDDKIFNLCPWSFNGYMFTFKFDESRKVTVDEWGNFTVFFECGRSVEKNLKEFGELDLYTFASELLK